ncbi:MAG: hypothetical protein QHH06_13810 [Clostridiales bacterium]|nr:hypothetical protein [Eubacteriales bacterium]MDH7567518.1 hypothetical protein [Clostridiales bacterium]
MKTSDFEMTAQPEAETDPYLFDTGSVAGEKRRVMPEKKGMNSRNGTRRTVQLSHFG